MAHEITSGLAGLLMAAIGASIVGAPERDPRTAYGPDTHIQIVADEIAWESGPRSLPDGAEYAVLEGDPSGPGMFVMRLKLPDGFVIPPHTHPGVERVTVISGAFHLGHGGRFDPDRLERLPAGSFTVMPPGMRHFAVAEGETVVQITSIGPWEIDYINPADDPRR
ncbi:MAG: cupin domain-containing protein [Phycisphaerales bacterium]|nr:cupin domain-containing protein [Planctomycetota bacterium]MCH8508179.1 cupin domain-containing protein [Phycisphaerales bacterium]